MSKVNKGLTIRHSKFVAGNGIVSSEVMFCYTNFITRASDINKVIGNYKNGTIERLNFHFENKNCGIESVTGLAEKCVKFLIKYQNQ